MYIENGITIEGTLNLRALKQILEYYPSLSEESGLEVDAFTKVLIINKLEEINEILKD